MGVPPCHIFLVAVNPVNVIEEVEINPQNNNEIDSILRDMNVCKISENGAKQAVLNGALDLTPHGVL